MEEKRTKSYWEKIETKYKYIWILDHTDAQAYVFSLPPVLYIATSEEIETYIAKYLDFSISNISWMVSNNINSKMSK